MMQKALKKLISSGKLQKGGDGSKYDALLAKLKAFPSYRWTKGMWNKELEEKSLSLAAAYARHGFFHAAVDVLESVNFPALVDYTADLLTTAHRYDGYYPDIAKAITELWDAVYDERGKNNG